MVRTVSVPTASNYTKRNFYGEVYDYRMLNSDSINIDYRKEIVAKFDTVW